ncbi:arabinose ABC transporter permease [Desulfitobacterium metallireducens DSM 15288]|uniref:Arabinose ABC transporter permease n=1 Tax=Desulfitobacterium metallireducens DSM 15288 TaxID=871968 RepID=W0E9F4_9FIRM|nr:arabinose ABC transporter permease [Desulfitobacterium metallireducens DSM 15288]
MQKSEIPPPVLILVLGGFIQSTGNSLMWPLNSLFMYNVLGRTLTEAGMLISAQALTTLLGQFVSGFLADRFGAMRMMHFGFIGAIISLGLIARFPVWEVYAPGLLGFGLSIAFIFVPLNALISQLWPEGGRRGFNLLYVFNNAGVAVGTALGGVVANYSFRLIFLFNALAFSIYLIFILVGVPAKNGVNTNATSRRSRQTLSHDLSFPVLLSLSGGILMVWAAYIQLPTVLPVIMTQLGFSLPQYSILWTLNGIFIVTLQPFIQWIIRHWAHSFTRQFYLSCLLIGISFVILLAQFPYYSYLLAMLVLTLGEMLIFPAVPAAAAQIAPKGKAATYQGIAAGAASGGRVLGPLFGGLVFDYWGGQIIWILALSFIGISIFAFFLYQRAVRNFQHLIPLNPET